MAADGRVLVLSDDAAFAAAASSVLAAQLPNALCESVTPERVRSCPEAMAVVIDGRADAAATLERARLIRAMGFGGAIAIVGASDAAGDDDAAQFGYAFVGADALATGLVAGLADALHDAESPFAESVRRARRLVAAGELALRLQHSLNNPLAAILAETQLMQLDATNEDERAALERIVVMCRRMVDLLRGLDGVGERKPR